MIQGERVVALYERRRQKTWRSAWPIESGWRHVPFGVASFQDICFLLVVFMAADDDSGVASCASFFHLLVCL